MDISEIQEILSRQIDHQDRDAAERKLNDCINAIGASVKLKAKAFGDLEKAKGKVMQNHPDLSVALLRLRMASQTTEEQEAYMMADRLNASLFKAIDGLKALLSIQAKEAVPKW